MIVRSRIRIGFLCWLFVSFQAIGIHRGLAQEYRFDPDTSTVIVQTDPLMMSRYPTTVSAALSVAQARLRTIDIDGNVWQWKLHPPLTPEKVASTGAEPACAALTGDGELLAWADFDSNLTVIHLDTGRTLVHENAGTSNIVAIRFSPDGLKLASVTRDGAIRVRELKSGAVLEMDSHPSVVQLLAFSPDGKTIAVSSFTPEIRLFDLHDPEAPVQELRAGGSPVTAQAFSPDGASLVVASADGSANVFSVGDRKTSTSLGSYPFAIWSLAFDVDGDRLFGGSWDGTVRVWNTKSWQQVQRMKGHEESVSVIVAADQGMMTGAMDGRLLFWPSVAEGVESLGTIRGNDQHQIWVSLISPNGKRLFFGGGNEQSEMWDFENRSKLFSARSHPVTRCAVFSPDGATIATGGDDKTICITSVESGEQLRRLEGHRGAISMLAFVDDGKTLISGCDGGMIKFWDTATGEPTASAQRHQQQLYCGAVSPDENWLVTGGGDWLSADPGELIVWDLQNREYFATLDGHRQTVWSIVFTSGSKEFASADAAGDVRIWDIETKMNTRTLSHDTWLRPMAMSPDGETLAVGRGDGRIQLWNTKDWTEKGTCVGHRKFAFSLDFSPDGSTLVSGSDDGTVRFWNVQRGSGK